MNIAINIGLCIACAVSVYAIGAFILWDWQWPASASVLGRFIAFAVWAWVMIGAVMFGPFRR